MIFLTNVSSAHHQAVILAYASYFRTYKTVGIKINANIHHIHSKRMTAQMALIMKGMPANVVFQWA